MRLNQKVTHPVTFLSKLIKKPKSIKTNQFHTLIYRKSKPQQQKKQQNFNIKKKKINKKT